MKNRTGAILTLALLLSNLTVFGQIKVKYDTIYVNTETTTYLIFDEPITLFNLGSKDYEAKADNPKILFVRVRTTLAKPSTIVVTHGEEIYTAYIAFKPHSQAFYDFRKPKIVKESMAETAENLEQKKVENKLGKLEKLSKNVLFKTEKQKVSLKLSHLYNDNQATYLKFSLENHSSIIYDLDYVSFAYIEKRKRKSKKINTLNSGFQELEPIVKIEKLLTESGKNNDYFYALPLYSTTEKGVLQIIFREKAGLRSITLEIPFKQILHATLF